MFQLGIMTMSSKGLAGSGPSDCPNCSLKPFEGNYIKLAINTMCMHYSCNLTSMTKLTNTCNCVSEKFIGTTNIPGE